MATASGASSREELALLGGEDNDGPGVHARAGSSEVSRSGAFQRLRRGHLRLWHVTAGFLAIGCLVLAVAGTSPRGLHGALETAATAFGSDLLKANQMEWQVQVAGGPNSGVKPVAREMAVLSKTGYVRCCECYGPEKRGSTPETCIGPVGWQEAKETCLEHGRRLCTKLELERGEATGTGCGFDDDFVWSTRAPYGFTSEGPGSVCRRDETDITIDGRGSAIVMNGVDTKMKCEAKCLEEARCKGYEYRTDEQRCEIWTKSINFHTTAIHKDMFECKVKTCPV